MSSQEFGVGVDHVGIAGHAVERENFAVREPDAGGLIPRCLDRGDGGIEPEDPAQILEQPHHALHESAGSASRKPHAPTPF